jgi:hypothetical protein
MNIYQNNYTPVSFHYYKRYIDNETVTIGVLGHNLERTAFYKIGKVGTVQRGKTKGWSIRPAG